MTIGNRWGLPAERRPGRPVTITLDTGFGMMTLVRREKMRKRIARVLVESPARLSILSFALLIAAGTALLMLPQATRGFRLGVVDALFTATSASCVTGLAVVDTGQYLSRFGQLVVLALIQAGGLGIMTISTSLLLVAGGRPGLTGRLLIKDTFTHSGERSLAAILRDALLFTFLMEALGTAALFVRFHSGHPPGEALYLSVFHAVSAFCNAGFSLFPQSFVEYRSDWLLNITICILVVCGGIGFLVFSEVKSAFPLTRRKWSRFSLHTKLVLTTTALLLVVSTLLFLLMEWDNTLKPLSLSARPLAALFQAVSARTAGFNTVAVGSLANETLFFMILLMFIGACPGSCGGGIKTTTFATLVVLGASRLGGRGRTQIFHRTIPETSVDRAVSLVMISVLVVAAGTMILLMTELGEVSHTVSRGKFLEIFFEVVSAFGTVGLSAGVTPELSIWGRLIITAVMFIGRLGPLVVALAFSRRVTRRFHYAEENIIIG